MKILVISDLHLNLPFEDRKFRYLQNLFSQVDKVILNGDFWEGFQSTFDDFYKSSWSKLFPVLRSKDTVYLFGNHDRKKYNDEKRLGAFTKMFGERYRLTHNKKTFIFEHGHRLWQTETDEVDKNSLKFRTTVKFLTTLEKIFIKTVGKHYQIGLKKINDQVLQQVVPRLKENEYFFFGHTHRKEALHDLRVFNTGICKEGLSQYVIIKNGEVKPYEEYY